MRKARFKETEIVRVLKEVEGGRQVKQVCREYGISDATYYNWKTKYGGMEIADIRKLICHTGRLGAHSVKCNGSKVCLATRPGVFWVVA